MMARLAVNNPIGFRQHWIFLVLSVSLLFILARQRAEDANVAAARRLTNATELIGGVLAWLLALCTIISAF